MPCLFPSKLFYQSIIGPLLFYILFVAFFFVISDISFASYADDNTPYTAADSIEKCYKKIEK